MESEREVTFGKGDDRVVRMGSGKMIYNRLFKNKKMGNLT